MIYTNLDIITRRYLMEKGLPIHWYLEVMTHCATGIRELSFDSLQVINAARLAINSYGAAPLPDDFVDELGVYLPIGDALYALPKQDWITPLRMHDVDSGAFVPYTTSGLNDDGSMDFLDFPGLWNWYWNVNNYGEPTGRLFGASGGTQQGYKILRERQQVQFTDNFQNSNATILYISDGQRADNATKVDTMAQQTIHAWCDWKRSPNAAAKDSYEAATYYNERRLLRARKSDLTKVDILNVIRNSYTAAIKS